MSLEQGMPRWGATWWRDQCLSRLWARCSCMRGVALSLGSSLLCPLALAPAHTYTHTHTSIHAHTSYWLLRSLENESSQWNMHMHMCVYVYMSVCVCVCECTLSLSLSLFLTHAHTCIRTCMYVPTPCFLSCKLIAYSSVLIYCCAVMIDYLIQ